MQLGPLVESLLDELCGVRALLPSPQAVLGWDVPRGLLPPAALHVAPSPGQPWSLGHLPSAGWCFRPAHTICCGHIHSLRDSVLDLVDQVFPQQSAGGTGGGRGGVLPAITV